ncbi:MAG TPA: S8 family serine peptidase [Firmicutes bacterium]|nr:S8 family serine peptidase [Bacillota bacterium]
MRPAFRRKLPLACILAAGLLLSCTAPLLSAAGPATRAPSVSPQPGLDGGAIVPPPSGSPRQEFLPGEVLVKPKIKIHPGVAMSQAVASAEVGVKTSVAELVGIEPQAVKVKPISMPDGSPLLVVSIPEGSEEEVARALSARPDVEYAEPNYLWYPDDAVFPTDPRFSFNYDLHNTGQVFVPPLGLSGTPDADIDMPEAWGIHQASGSIVVAVIDTGIFIDHPELAGQIWTNPGEIPDNGVDDDGNGYVDDVHGWDFFNNDNTVFDLADGDEHGTHVAGTIGALMNNGIGSAGINGKIQIMPLKFIGPNGGSTEDAVRAIEYAASFGVKISNNSWGGGGYSDALRDAIASSGMLFVAAAGNDGLDNDVAPHYPSSYDLPNVLAVASSDWNDELSGFSNYGATSVDLAAPGDFIFSTWVRNVNGTAQPAFAWASGTSMATPHVAGVAALLLDKYPDLPLYPGAPGAQPDSPTLKDVLMYSGDYKPAYQGLMVAPVRLNAERALGQVIAPIIQNLTVNGRPFGNRTTPGQAVAFTVTAETPFSTVASITWDFGDGQEAAGATVTHVYGRPGVYEVRVTVTDDDGDASTALATVEVVEDNRTVVLVDDDGSAASEIPLINALEAAGLPYVVAAPQAILRLNPQDHPNPIFWETGTELSALNVWEQGFIAAFLDAGGRLFLSGQDVLEGLAGSDFLTRYLHVQAFRSDTGADVIEGIPGDPVTGGIGRIRLQFPEGITDRADDLTPTEDADPIFTTSLNTSPALRYISSDQQGPRLVLSTVYFGAIPLTNPDPSNARGFVLSIYHFLTGQDVNLPPVVLKTGGSFQIGDAPLTVQVNATVEDPVPQPLAVAYAYWDFGDGSPVVGAKPQENFAASHTYQAPGFYRATLRVVDDQGEDTIAYRNFLVLPPGTKMIAVDDGDNPGTFGLITGVLDQLGVRYVAVTPDLLVDETGILDGAWQYPLLWTTGEIGYTDHSEVAALEEFMDQGGHLILSGQDELFNIWEADPQLMEFATDYLKVADVAHDVGAPHILGQPGDPISDGVEIYPQFPFADWSDIILPAQEASPLFWRDMADYGYPDYYLPNALRYDGSYHLLFLAFPLEAVPYQYRLSASPTSAAGPGGAVAVPLAGESSASTGTAQVLKSQRKAGAAKGMQLEQLKSLAWRPTGEVGPFVPGTLPLLLGRALSASDAGIAPPLAPLVLAVSADQGPVEPGVAVTLQALAEDVDGTIVEAWVETGDGARIDVLAGDSRVIADVTHTYSEPGVYDVTYYFKDDAGNEAVGSSRVTVAYLPQASLEPAAVEVSLSPAIQAERSLTLHNSDEQAELHFTAEVAEAPAWLTVEPAAGTVSPASSASLRLLFNTDGLEAGQDYTATVVVQTDDPDRPRFDVLVTLHIVTPAAAVNPGELSFMLNPDEQATRAITVSNEASGEGAVLAFTASVDGETGWLSVSPAQGEVAPEGTAELTVTVDTTALVAGDYQGKIVIATNDPEKPEIQIPVTLQVRPINLQVLSPQAGDVWTGVKEIRWQAEDPESQQETEALKITLEYSPDGGTTWKSIATDEANDGRYSWDTRSVEKGGNRFVVRVTATDPEGHAATATSGVFTVAVVRNMVTHGPNPAREYVTFYYNLSEPAKLYVYDISGHLVLAQDLAPAANHYRWDLTDAAGRPLASGLYLYTVVTESGQASPVERLVIKR